MLGLDSPLVQRLWICSFRDARIPVLRVHHTVVSVLDPAFTDAHALAVLVATVSLASHLEQHALAP